MLTNSETNTTALLEIITQRLRLPLIAAPMLSVSGPELVIAACRNGVIGAFPVANARTVEGLTVWLRQIEEALKAEADVHPEQAASAILSQPDYQANGTESGTRLFGPASHQDGHYQCWITSRGDWSSA